MLSLINKPLNSQAFSSIKKTETRYAYNMINVVDKDPALKYTTSYITNLKDSSTYSAYIKDLKKANSAKGGIQFTFSYINDYAAKNLKCSGIMIQNGNRM